MKHQETVLICRQDRSEVRKVWPPTRNERGDPRLLVVLQQEPPELRGRRLPARSAGQLRVLAQKVTGVAYAPAEDSGNFSSAEEVPVRGEKSIESVHQLHRFAECGECAAMRT